MIKKAAALANMELGVLDKKIGDSIVKASDEVIEGKFDSEFVIDVYQAGAGTSFNMNTNEVIANRAIEVLKGKKGDYKIVNPNDHVNMSQSTNDTFPTAMRLSTLLLLEEFIPALRALEKSFKRKAKEFDKIIKSGRTHLQDAVPIRLGQEFSAYGEAVRKCTERIIEASKSLKELGIGGSAAGTGLNSHPKYRFAIVKHLKKISGLNLKNSKDMREAMQSQAPIAEISGAIRILALELTRIANDLRLMSSGPNTGLNEILLPSLQPGSSIMPGKVNPVMCEVMNMVCYQVMGHDTTVAMSVQAGQFELNVMMPVMIYNVLQAIEIFKNTIKLFIEKCVDGITANVEKCREYAYKSAGLTTALNMIIGYSAAAEITKEFVKTGRPIPEIVRQKGILKEEELQKILDPIAMTEPGIPGKKF
jgi:aspartate ammonia-lyase